MGHFEIFAFSIGAVPVVCGGLEALQIRIDNLLIAHGDLALVEVEEVHAHVISDDELALAGDGHEIVRTGPPGIIMAPFSGDVGGFTHANYDLVFLVEQAHLLVVRVADDETEGGDAVRAIGGNVGAGGPKDAS